MCEADEDISCAEADDCSATEAIVLDVSAISSTRSEMARIASPISLNAACACSAFSTPWSASRAAFLTCPHHAIDTVRDLLDALAHQIPALARTRGMVAVNQEYVTPEAPLKDGDEVALIPPVSGG